MDNTKGLGYLTAFVVLAIIAVSAWVFWPKPKAEVAPTPTPSETPDYQPTPCDLKTDCKG